MANPTRPLEELSREELIELIRGLMARVMELEAENERLRREGKRQAAPFSKGEKKADPKSPGRKPGQGPFRYRVRPAPGEITAAPVAVPVSLECCPGCGGTLVGERTDFCWRTELPPLPRPEVKEYRVQVSRCQGCGWQVRGEHPEVAPGQQGASAHRLGPRLLAAAHVLHYGVGIPLRRVPGVLGELCGIKVTQGALTQAAMRAAASGEAAERAYEILRGEVAAAPLVNFDATGWRVEGERAQLVVDDTKQGSFYQILSSLTSEEIRAVQGEDFKGAARRFSTCLSELLLEALALWRKWREAGIAEEEYRSEARRIEKAITHQLRRRTLRDRDNQRLLDGIGAQYDRGHLLRFLDDPGVVDPTNNAAERGLRPNVIARKVSQCSKNWRGAAARTIFTSLIRTSEKRLVRSAITALMQILDTGIPPPTPTPA